MPKNTDSKAKADRASPKFYKKPTKAQSFSFSPNDGNTKRGQALRMAKVGKRGTAEIADSLGVNARTVRKWLQEAHETRRR